MIKRDKPEGMSRRERQILDSLYRLGKASAAEVRDALPDPPTYTAIFELTWRFFRKRGT